MLVMSISCSMVGVVSILLALGVSLWGMGDSEYIGHILLGAVQ